eukprot:CAMPEP_0203764134 /NCGR_PEP_ID=MMETSP0098-20131031/17453_1 /ASSEMBLY_ACC=CAM_ASM_000208 /TAXON_ID=96639 /ORGANISM=" , Strain NY0313808BC1" /LENGTH=507 /DNA_ID=CAMNT_0050659845 /DNA_START=39 /DNA_END=1562 /DNA_ORIENTATION=-
MQTHPGKSAHAGLKATGQNPAHRIAARDAADLGETNDKRCRRIENGKVYSKGVQAFRDRTRRSQLRPKHQGLTKVLVRPRPLFEHEKLLRGEWDCVSCVGSSVVVHEGVEKVRARQGCAKVLRNHTFNGVYPVVSNEETYDGVQELIQRATEGQLTTLFMYGMTGSGKTYSMSQIHERAPQQLFDGLEKNATIVVFAYELVGKNCYDLLSNEKKSPVLLRVGADGMTHVSGAVEHNASTPDELSHLLLRASTQRETSATGTNAASSRTHAVYQLKLPNTGGLIMIDLAGNEGNIETLYHTKQQMSEAAEINSSLSTLKACLHARATGASYIPFRESLLTRVLKDSLVDPTATTAVLACVSPACSHLERTLGTMRAAIQLTGQTCAPPVEEETLKNETVIVQGPKKWDRETLSTWLQCQPFGDKVELGPEMNGAQVMKFTAVRLASMCGNDRETGKKLFEALRVEAKTFAKRDLELRRNLKQHPKSFLTSSMSFSKSAPSKPVIFNPN